MKQRQTMLGIWVLALTLVLSVATIAAANHALSAIIGSPQNTDLKLPGSIVIQGVGQFFFAPHNVERTRPEIFDENHISVFDVLRYVAQESGLDFAYEYDVSLDTHVITSLAGHSSWWYVAFYDGGSRENNAHRMDYYVYKDKMTIQVQRVQPESMVTIYATFRNEVDRRNANRGKVIIPEVTIVGSDFHLIFRDVEVSAHDIRPDVFQPGVITAADVILSLAAEGRLSYGLTWVESIGTVDVKAYFLTRINMDIAHGNTGFVYELGERMPAQTWTRFLHVTTDLRLLCSPEFVSFQWRTVGGR